MQQAGPERRMSAATLMPSLFSCCLTKWTNWEQLYQISGYEGIRVAECCWHILVLYTSASSGWKGGGGCWDWQIHFTKWLLKWYLVNFAQMIQFHFHLKMTLKIISVKWRLLYSNPAQTHMYAHTPLHACIHAQIKSPPLRPSMQFGGWLGHIVYGPLTR